MNARPLLLVFLAFPAIPAFSAEPLPANGDGCASHLDGAAASRQVMIGDRAATAAGHRLTFTDPAPGGKLVLGVLGPINEDSGANLFVFRRYLQFFKKEGAAAVVLSGDVGEVGAGVERVLSELARSGVPVLAVAGNRECGGDFKRAFLRAQKAHSNLVNLNTVRLVELGGATLVSLPGYHDPNFISCTTGCRYDRRTLDEVVRLAGAAKEPVVLVSHGPPRGTGPEALDRAVKGGNTGDPEINKAILAARIPFGIFSNVKEAGARATDLEGQALIPQEKPVPALYLNPGPADTTPWEMNDRTTGHGFAATLTISGREASWKLYRSPRLTREEKAEARRLLDPPRHRGEVEDPVEDSEGSP